MLFLFYNFSLAKEVAEADYLQVFIRLWMDTSMTGYFALVASLLFGLFFFFVEERSSLFLIHLHSFCCCLLCQLCLPMLNFTATAVWIVPVAISENSAGGRGKCSYCAFTFYLFLHSFDSWGALSVSSVYFTINGAILSGELLAVSHVFIRSRSYDNPNSRRIWDCTNEYRGRHSSAPTSLLTIRVLTLFGMLPARCFRLRNGMQYVYMDESKAKETFDKLMVVRLTLLLVLDTIRPNVVIIVIESFTSNLIATLR